LSFQSKILERYVFQKQQEKAAGSFNS